MKTLYESILDDEDEKMNSMGKDIEANLLKQAETDFEEWKSIAWNKPKIINKKIKNGKVCFDLKGTGALKTVDIYKNIPDSFYIEKVDGDVYVGGAVDSLNGFPEYINGSLYIVSNKKLKSLKGCPKIIKNDFGCLDTSIESLEEGPIEVGGEFDISKTNIKTLKGMPKKIGKNIILKSCKNLKSLKYLPSTPNVVDLSNIIDSIDLSELKYINGRIVYISDWDITKQEDVDKAIGSGKIRLRINKF